MNDKNILLITFTNRIYRDKFTAKGYSITEFGLPFNDDSLNKIRTIDFRGTAVIEIIDDSMNMLEDIITGLRKNSVRVIAVAAKINDIFRDYFLKHGIAEVIESGSAGKAVVYIDITGRETNKKYGKILILENDPQKINIFETIIGRFNYTPILIQKTDDLFEYLSESNIQLVFVNLGAENFEISYFLKKILAGNTKKIPIIPYKDISQGLFIHEMISGLNKISKVILNTEEVFSFLIDILFRKELSPGLNLLNETLDFNSLNNFTSEPLSRIYNIMGINIFTMKRIITQDNINIINGRIHSLRNLIIKVDGIKWLLKENSSNIQSIGIGSKFNFE